MPSTDLAFGVFAAIMLSLLIYHGLILARIIDFKNVWGGRLESSEQMVKFEIVSVVMLIIFTAIVYVRASGEDHIVIVALSGVVALFLFFNTITNLMAIQKFERYVFTPLAFIAGLSALRITIG